MSKRSWAKTSWTNSRQIKGKRGGEKKQTRKEIKKETQGNIRIV